VNLHYRLDGPADAPALALANSLGTELDLWEPQLAAFANAFRVVRFDLPGHGRSPVPERPFSIQDIAGGLAQVLDEAGIERASVCGLSLGGAVAMALAEGFPDRVERVVLACTTARFGAPETWRERAVLVRREGVGPVVEAALERWFTKGFRQRRPEVIQTYREQYLRTTTDGYAGCCDALAGWDFRDQLGGIHAPALVVGAEGDPVVPPEAARATAAALPGAHLEMIAGAAHLVSVEQPRVFERAVMAHLMAHAGKGEGI
jgi:3-oxoadipate enol-lactonase